LDRDNRVKTELRKNGWRSLTIWQCELQDHDGLAMRLKEFLQP
jgi:G:T-mismatch repair DNA endonuclease (very short patch repair protein)